MGSQTHITTTKPLDHGSNSWVESCVHRVRQMALVLVREMSWIWMWQFHVIILCLHGHSTMRAGWCVVFFQMVAWRHMKLLLGESIRARSLRSVCLCWLRLVRRTLVNRKAFWGGFEVFGWARQTQTINTLLELGVQIVWLEASNPLILIGACIETCMISFEFNLTW